MPSTKVFTEDGREVQPGSGEIGHIAAGGMLVPIAYFKDPEKSARTFRVIGGERYAFIGDIGTIEADGSLRVLDRGSGCINTAGEKVFAEEVEAVLMTYPDVDDCLVLGAPHERFGQCVAAIVATREPRQGLVQSIDEHCRKYMTAYKCPRIIELRDRVERGPHGKVDYGCRGAYGIFLGLRLDWTCSPDGSRKRRSNGQQPGRSGGVGLAAG